MYTRCIEVLGYETAVQQRRRQWYPFGGGRLERGNDRARGGIKMGVVAKEVVVNAKLFVSLLKTLIENPY